jgi:hypothetical protein
MVTFAAGSLACPGGEVCVDALDFFSGSTGNLMPDAARGAACTLTMSAGDASLRVDISAVDGGLIAQCSSTSLPPGAVFCDWTSGFETISVQTFDPDAGQLVNDLLGNPSDHRASASLVCNGKPVVGAPGQTLLQRCFE